MKWYQRLIAAVTAGCLMIGCLLSVSADGVPEEAVTTDFSGTVPAKSYILMEASTGQVLAEQNADEAMAPASITKIMVMLLLMERMEEGSVTLDDMVTTSEHANSMGGTQIWLEVGEQMSVRDLLKATAVNSANDAAVALAEHMAGSEENFVQLMNQRAKELGMKHTTFKNATGLDADGHLSTARDIALMSRELIQHEQIKEYTSIWMDSLRDGTTGLSNTNKLVRFYEGCNGLKTGTTDEAGSCLSATATRDGMTLIAVSMGSATSKERFAAARTLLDYGFATYGLYTPQLDESQIHPVPVNNGQKGEVKVKVESMEPLVVSKTDMSGITQEVSLSELVEAPVEAGQQLGIVTFQLNGTVLTERPILADESVESLSFSFVLQRLFQKLLGTI